MTSGQETLLALGVFGVLAAAAYGWFSDKSRKLKEDDFNINLRRQLYEKEAEAQRQLAARHHELDTRHEHLLSMRREFEAGYLQGRAWLAKFIAEADKTLDDALADRLRSKKQPAYKAAEEVSAARAERRKYKERAKFLEYQLLSLKEYFPFLEEYEEIILDEAVPLGGGEDGVTNLDDADPVLRYVQRQEYEQLSSAVRNQLALDRYLSGNLSPAAIGRLYERYLGHLYESDGWAVEYHGIIQGLEDLGRDLICRKGNEVHIVQAKCWSSAKTIHEKHIFQLFGTTQLFLMAAERGDLYAPKVTARFVTSTTLSEVARQAADWLKIEVEERKVLDKTFPMIKCNVNRASKEKIYHLPFDQQYDRTKIDPALGEFYAKSAADAEKKGFRRAFRYTGGAR